MAGYLIRRLVLRSDVKRVAELVNKEGWNLSLEYLQTAFDANPSGWWGAEGVDGRIIGCFAVFDVNDNETSQAGFGVVEKMHCHQRIEMTLVRTALSKLRQRNVLIFTFHNNLKLFKPFYEIVMLRTRKSSMMFPPLLSTRLCILPLTDISLDRAEQYDAKIHADKRTTFFYKCIIAKAASVYVALDKSSNDVIGYGVLQRANEGWKLGPTYADNDDVGYELSRTLYDEVPEGDAMVVYPYAENHAAIALYREIGFTYQHTFTLLYSERLLNIPVEKVYSAVGPSFAPMKL